MQTAGPPMNKPYNLLPDLIRYFVWSRRSMRDTRFTRTRAAARARWSSSVTRSCRTCFRGRWR